MALMALNWTFVFKIMARNTYLVCNILAPPVNHSNLGLVAIETVIMHIILVLPMLKPEFHYPHLEIDDFTASVLWCICHSRSKVSRDNQYPCHQ